MEMECRADSSSTVSEWSMLRPFSTNKKTIFVNSKGQQKAKNEHFGIVEGINGSVVLYTNWTGMKDAGIYTCAVQKTLKQPYLYSAHLIVVEAEPLCETNLSTSENNTFEEGTHLWMSCTVNFRGSWTPTIEWRLYAYNAGTDEEPTDLTDRANAEIVLNANISSTLTIALAATSNSSYYACKIYFPLVNNSELVTASNLPDYGFIWKSPIVTSLPKPVEPATQREQMTNDDSANNLNDLKTFNVFNAIYLVAGVAVLFGIASSLVTLILCLRLRIKNSVSAATENFDQTQLTEGEYDLIPYSCSDGYDTIEEVDIKDDILVSNVPPRFGPLSSPSYSVLGPIESRPPGIYSRMEHKEYSAEDKANDIGWQFTNPDVSTSGQSKLSEAEDSTKIHSYIYLETNVCCDSAAVGEACLKVTDDALESNSGNSVYEPTQRDHSIGKPTTDSSKHVYAHLVTSNDKKVDEIGDRVPFNSIKIKSYSDKTMYETTQKEDSNRKITLDSSNYTELLTKPDEEIGEDGYEIPSDNTMMTEDCRSAQTAMFKEQLNRMLKQ